MLVSGWGLVTYFPRIEQCDGFMEKADFTLR